jgi:putative ABC transport system permease protein
MIREALVLALRAIRRNALRSALTTLGIVIGVAAVIVMVTLGSGATAQVTENIASLGSNLLMIMPGQQGGPAQSVVTPFKIADADAIAREVAGVVAVAPLASKSVTAIAGNASWTTQVTGSTNALFTVASSAPPSGRAFLAAAIRWAARSGCRTCRAR